MFFKFRWFPRRKSAKEQPAPQPQPPASSNTASTSTSQPQPPSQSKTQTAATPVSPPPAPTISVIDKPIRSAPSNASLSISGRSRPIPNSYWATPLLVACEYPWTPQNPDRPKLDSLLRAGVRTFIDLTECGELIPYTDILGQRAVLLGIDPSSIEYHRFPMRDRSLPASPGQMEQIMNVLRDNERRRRVSAVHCRGGIGRTGVVIGCWLVESGVVRDGAEALERIAKEWKTVEKCKRYPHSPETGPQFDFVFSFQPFPSKPSVVVETRAAGL